MPRRAAAAAVAVLLMAVGCSSAPSPGRGTRGSVSEGASSRPGSTPPVTSPRPTISHATSTTTSTSPPPSGNQAKRVLAKMSEAERVGQLLMVDCPSTGATPDTRAAIQSGHVGSVILDGTSQLGVQQTAAITADLQQQAAGNADPDLFIATDQEGGQVQRLQGPGFSAIPSALQQGTQSPPALGAMAKLWGAELKNAGVNVDLGPVLDTVPAGFGANPPIGDLDREYGHDPAAVSSHGSVVIQGLQAAGVDATAKHFPGLGRVRGNTDVTTGVLDKTTMRTDPYLAPFKAAIQSHVAFVMISTAIYTNIDRNQPAAFSRTIVTDMLRGDLHFPGVIISDDLGISAQVSGTSPGERAVKFIAAGGDIVLTVDATRAPEMATALLAKTKSDPKFKAQVDAAALAVLQAKQARGLLH